MRPGSRDVKVLGADQAGAGMRGAEGTAVSRQLSIVVRREEGRGERKAEEREGIKLNCS